VPADHHAPIHQDAILLAHGKDNAAARAFLDYLRSDAARPVIERFGYVAGE
jgi:molybdate transport system substrate-binding protein